MSCVQLLVVTVCSLLAALPGSTQIDSSSNVVTVVLRGALYSSLYRFNNVSEDLTVLYCEVFADFMAHKIAFLRIPI